MLTFLNDFYLKQWSIATAWNGITGKISDFTGLFFFPIFFIYILHRWFDREFNECLVKFSCVTTLFLFVVFKYVDILRLALYDLFGHLGISIRIVKDYTDLIAVISLIVAFLFLQAREPTAE